MEYWHYDRLINSFSKHGFSTSLLAIRIVAICFFIDAYIKDDKIDK